MALIKEERPRVDPGGINCWAVTSGAVSLIVGRPIHTCSLTDGVSLKPGGPLSRGTTARSTPIIKSLAENGNFLYKNFYT